jgi:HSP20 family molecular chaperone IbpA
MCYEVDLDYLDFELEVESGGPLEYLLTVIRSPAGETKSRMRFPFGELELNNYIEDLQIALLRSRLNQRKIISAEEETVRDFGRALFDALMTGEIRSLYDISRDKAACQDKGLRLKLRIHPPELATLPWEFLYDSRLAEYVCLSRETPVIRYIELPQTIKILEVPLPLRILVMIACPQDLPLIDVEIEKQRIKNATMELQKEGLMDVAFMEGSTWRDLQKYLQGGPWHVFHFIGHGGFDLNSDEGLIVLTNDEGNKSYLTATKLARLLADHKSLRLVLLNSCEGAKGSKNDIFSSTATVLVRRGILAVLAMQYEITDRAAIEFARAFYEALVRSLPVDASVAEARKAVDLAMPFTLEWGTPVLYMRSTNGVLFRLNKELQHIPIDQSSTSELNAEIHPSLKGLLFAESEVVELGNRIEWKLKLRNDGNCELHQVIVTHKGKLLENPITLSIDEERIFAFNSIYKKCGMREEKVTVLGVSSDGKRLSIEITGRIHILKSHPLDAPQDKSISEGSETEKADRMGEQQNNLAILYTQALNANKLGNWTEVISICKVILNVDREYRDVKYLMQHAEDEAKKQILETEKNGETIPIYVDIINDDKYITILADISGVDKENIDLKITEDELYLEASPEINTNDTGQKYHMHERIYPLKRTLKLPITIKPEEVKARYENGVLEIKAPKDQASSANNILNSWYALQVSRINRMMTKKIPMVPTDIYEISNTLFIEMDLPGADKNNIDLRMTENNIYIEASRKGINNDIGLRYIIQERANTLKRSVMLPITVKPENAKAKFENGTLKVSLPIN